MREQPLVVDLTHLLEGKVAWVLGDLHGRFALLEAFLDHIEFDPEKHVIFQVGDTVDRGEDNVKVFEFVRQFAHCVRGNHEYMWLEMQELFGALPYDGEGNIHPLYAYLEHGKIRNNGHWETLVQFANSGRITAKKMLDYFESLPTAIVAGDYLIVHAGVFPDKAWEEHTECDLVWVREEYTEHRGLIPPECRMGKRLITGHTETWRYQGGLGQPFVFPDRILLDLGAASNVGLGAFCLNTAETLFFEGPNYEQFRKELLKKA